MKASLISDGDFTSSNRIFLFKNGDERSATSETSQAATLDEVNIINNFTSIGRAHSMEQLLIAPCCSNFFFFFKSPYDCLLQMTFVENFRSLSWEGTNSEPIIMTIITKATVK